MILLGKKLNFVDYFEVDTSILMVGIITFGTISIVAKRSINLTKTWQSQVHLDKNDDNSLFF